MRVEVHRLAPGLEAALGATASPKAGGSGKNGRKGRRAAGPPARVYGGLALRFLWSVFHVSYSSCSLYPKGALLVLP